VSGYLDLSSLPSGERERILFDLFSERPAMPETLAILDETHAEKRDFSTVTDAELVDALRMVVAENPDNVYTAPDHMASGDSCFYVHYAPFTGDLTAGCMVGAALERLGVPLEDLSAAETLPADTVLIRYFPQVSGKTCRLFKWAQRRQDEGKTWIDSLRFAEMNCD
jgi:hypothetical protein